MPWTPPWPACRACRPRAPRTSRWSARGTGTPAATVRPRSRRPPTAAPAGLPEDAVRRLLHRHGDRIADVLDLARSDPALGRPLTGGPDYLAAEVVHAVSAEGAL